jgi:pimeloyl-ACP methyl ester carboxylesterase
MNIEKATGVGPSRVDIAYERIGDPAAPALVLVMGAGTQLLGWPDDFCARIAAHGLHVVRFDNRDVGESTHFHDAPVPDLAAVIGGDASTASYTLSDMAGDTVGLLDRLGIRAAHLVGASLGGFVAQTLAIEHPARVLSLTSMMSTTGDRAVGQLPPEARAIFGWPRPTSAAEAGERGVRLIRTLGSPGFEHDLDAIRARAAAAWERDHDPLGIARQAVASVASGDRTEKLRRLHVPALVVHGTADRMCDPSGGRATAAAIPGAELLLVEGMGHDLPRAVWPRVIDALISLVRRSATRDPRHGVSPIQ